MINLYADHWLNESWRTYHQYGNIFAIQFREWFINLFPAMPGEILLVHLLVSLG